MKKFNKEKLSGKMEFKKVFSEGKRVESENLLVFILKNKFNFNRPGIIVKKEIGNAVTRNKIMRRLRETYRQINRKLFQGCDIIILVKKNIVELEYTNVYNELEGLFISKTFLYKTYKERSIIFNQNDTEKH